MKVTVLEIVPVNDGCLRAFVSFQVGPLVIHRARWVQQKGQRGFVQPPQEVVTVNGRTVYLPILKWPAQWHEQITAAVADALSDHPHGFRQTVSTEFGREVQARAGVGGER